MASYDNFALLLPGGGALASYQAGAYQTLSESGLEPNWVAGISSGALNSAIIAGNSPENRVNQLRSFWRQLSKYSILNSGYLSAWKSFLFGNEPFFQPRGVPAFLQPHFGYATASWYDATPLCATLAKFADFDRINDAREMRVSVGAVHVRSGAQLYFDNTHTRLQPEHFLASCALPPGFPPIEIDGEFYWDGGMVSNTPLECLMHEKVLPRTLALQVDLWSTLGTIPVDTLDVATAMRDIQYLPKTTSIYSCIDRLSEARRILSGITPLVDHASHESTPYLEAIDYINGTEIDIIGIVYNNKEYNKLYNTFDFSCESLRKHWKSGASDMKKIMDTVNLLQTQRAPGSVDKVG